MIFVQKNYDYLGPHCVGLDFTGWSKPAVSFSVFLCGCLLLLAVMKQVGWDE